MLTPHDYLELSFEDYFGLWSPEKQTFGAAIRQQNPAKRDAMFAHCGLLPRLLNGNLSGLQTAALDGTGVLW
jgi:hypothetical protein